MRLSLICLTALALGVLAGCASKKPKDGDTIRPALEQPLQWTSGKPIELSVRLQAEATDGSKPRVLDFTGVEANANPVAHITFYDGEKVLQTKDVELSHRC